MNFEEAWLVDSPMIPFDVYITRLHIVEPITDTDFLQDDYNGYF